MMCEYDVQQFKTTCVSSQRGSSLHDTLKQVRPHLINDWKRSTGDLKHDGLWIDAVCSKMSICLQKRYPTCGHKMHEKLSSIQISSMVLFFVLLFIHSYHCLSPLGLTAIFISSFWNEVIRPQKYNRVSADAILLDIVRSTGPLYFHTDVFALMYSVM